MAVAADREIGLLSRSPKTIEAETGGIAAGHRILPTQPLSAEVLPAAAGVSAEAVCLAAREHLPETCPSRPAKIDPRRGDNRPARPPPPARTTFPPHRLQAL